MLALGAAGLASKLGGLGIGMSGLGCSDVAHPMDGVRPVPESNLAQRQIQTDLE